MVYEFLLHEGVLNDNTLLVPSKGKVFKGQYIAVVKEYKFASAWHNTEEIKKFRSTSRLLNYLDKNYPEIVDELDFTGTCLEDISA